MVIKLGLKDREFSHAAHTIPQKGPKGSDKYFFRSIYCHQKELNWNSFLESINSMGSIPRLWSTLRQDCRIPYVTERHKKCLERFLSHTERKEKWELIPNHYLLLPAFPIMAFLSVYLFFVVCFIFFCVAGSHFNKEEMFCCGYGQQLIFILVIDDEEAELGYSWIDFKFWGIFTKLFWFALNFFFKKIIQNWD